MAGAQGHAVPAAVADHVDQVLHGVQRPQRRRHGHHVLSDLLVLRRPAGPVVSPNEHHRSVITATVASDFGPVYGRRRVLAACHLEFCVSFFFLFIIFHIRVRVPFRRLLVVLPGSARSLSYIRTSAVHVWLAIRKYIHQEP